MAGLVKYKIKGVKKSMKRICTIFLSLTCLAMLLTSCGDNNINEREKPAVSSDNVETITDTIDKPTPKVSEVDLVHTYTTRFEEVNLVTYPAFSFDYSDNWSVTKEDVTPTSEWVTLSNERGATIDFINIHEKSIGGGSAVVCTEVEVSKVADSNFTPGYVQATDYSDLGKFMVAELKTVGTMDTMTEKDFVPIEDGSVSYAVLPESSIGQHTVNGAYYMDLAFWYSGNTLLLASAPDGQFTPQEGREAIAILSSFRSGIASHASEDALSDAIDNEPEIKVPEPVILDLEEAAPDNFKYEYDEKTAGIKILEYIGTDVEVRIPEKIDGQSVTCIGTEAFRGSDITYLSMPDTITTIEKLALRDCENLTNVIISDHVTEIGYGAFYKCSSLTSIVIPDGVQKINGIYNTSWSRSYGTFSDCTSLTNVVIPDSVTEIGYGAFSNCSNLKSIELPDTITEIGEYAFAHCNNLKDVEIPNGVTVIEWETFAYCDSLENVKIPDSVTKIDEDAFYKCARLNNETKQTVLTINPNSGF